MTINFNYTIDEIFAGTGGRWLMHTENAPVKYLSLDSRKVVDPASTLFWAIKSESRDASDFISELYQRGVQNFVTQTVIDTSFFAGANIILVSDSVQALQQLAIIHRKKFPHIHIIGITGSNGKTIVKEWLNQLLSPFYTVVRSPRSFNSQIGVPLSVLQINETHQVGIFEAGISMSDEMQHLEMIIRPQTGIFTNIGSAHDEGFENRAQKIAEKLKLFIHSESLTFPARQKEIGEVIGKTPALQHTLVYPWGSGDFTFRITSVIKENSRTAIQIRYQEKDYWFSIPFTDDASIENAISCFCGLMPAGLFRDEMLQGFSQLHSVSMRLELKPGQQRCSIINDSYSNDLQSLEVAASFLQRQSHKRSTVILSDLLESGLEKKELYTRVAGILQKNGVNRLIGIGMDISTSAPLFSSIPDASFFVDTKAFNHQIADFNFHDETILVKGARKFSFEKIAGLLEEQQHETILSVNLSSLAYNVRVYRSMLKPGTKIMAMVKAFAYGSGSRQISSMLEYIKADYLAVAYTQEGIALREAGIDLPMMVMNAEPGSFDKLIKYRLEPEIFSTGILQSFTEFLRQEGIKDYPVHLKIDTGMHRLGFSDAQTEEMIRGIKDNPAIKIMSAFSHFSSSEKAKDDDFSRKQFAIFKSVTDRLNEVISCPFLRHICNSAATYRFPEFQLDMVRLGKGMYGVTGDAELDSRLKVVNELSTTISQIKKIKAGEVVGYERNEVKEDKAIATMKIGYADGFRRVLGNGRGKVMVHGHLIPTVGNVCMDMTMIDVTGIEDVKEGDKVIIFGEALSVEKVAGWAGTIALDIYTGISSRVRRIYYEDA